MNIFSSLLLALFTFFLLSTTSFAQGPGQGIHTPGTGITNPQMKQQGSGQGVQTTPVPTVASPSGTPAQQQERDRLQLYLQDQDRIMVQDRLKMQDQDRLIYQDQDRVLLGALFLREVQKTVPNVNPQFAQLGKQLQQSTQVTLHAEKSLRSQNDLVTFFFGSDVQDAAQLEQAAQQNKASLRKVSQLTQQCACDVQVKNMIQQQVMSMNQEQDRLIQLAAEEKSKKGIFAFGNGQ